jgi:hypothetical protein
VAAFRRFILRFVMSSFFKLKRDFYLQRVGVSVQKAKRLFIAALFGSVIFVTRVFVPSPIDKLLIVVDAVLLALSALFIKKVGATYVGAVGSVLTSLWRPSLIPFSIIFAFLYGIMVDVFLFLFKVNATTEGVNRNRLMTAMAFSTMLIAFLSYYVTTVFPQLIQRYPVLDMAVLFMGPVTGAVAGYAAAYLWNRYLKNINVAL